MIKKAITCFSFLGLLSSCGSSSSSSSIDNITESVKQGVPQITSAIAATSVYANSTFSAYSSSDNDLTWVLDTFKLSCHTSDNSVNFCSAIGQTPNDDNILSMGRLMGFIEHARMYLQNVTWSQCEATTPVTPVFTSAASGNFVISVPARMTYAGMKDTNIAGNQYSIVCGKTASIYHGVVARYNYSNQYDIFQTYYTTSGDNPNILAFNYASYNPDGWGQRIILITNMQQHKFIFKTCSSGVSSNCTTAYGTAGFDVATNTWVDGYYEVKAGYSSTKYYCIKNGATAEVNTDGSHCSSLDALFSSSAGSDNWSTVATFLGLGETDQSDLVNFKPFVMNADNIEASQIPSSVNDIPSAVQ